VTVVKFCPKCGSMMVVSLEEDRVYLVCPTCGYREELPPDQAEAVRKAMTNIARRRKRKVPKSDVFSDKYRYMGMSKAVGVRCPRCGSEEVYYQMAQTRAADEPMTRFYICAKCGYKWRESS